MQAVVMAGGAGTRLGPVTTPVPTALLPIVGQPMLGQVVDLLARHGIHRCVVSLQHQASMILKYCNDGSGQRIDLRFLTEPKPLEPSDVADTQALMRRRASAIERA